MWYDFESKFTFTDHKNIVYVDFSQCSGEFVVSVQVDGCEKITHRTNDENEAKKLFAIVVHTLQDINFRSEEFGKIFEKQEG